MDLNKVKTVSDKGSHFLVSHADHGEFPVAKKGLPPEMVEKIGKMCNGGVSYAADSDVVPPTTPPAVSDDVQSSSQPNYDIGGAPDILANIPITANSVGRALTAQPGGTTFGAPTGPGVLGVDPNATNTTDLSLTGAPNQPAGPPEPPQAAGPQGIPVTQVVPITPVPPAPDNSLNLQITPGNDKAPGFKPDTDTSELQRAYLESQRGISLQAKATQDAEKERDAAYGNQQQTIQGYKDEYQKRVNASNKEFDDLQKQITTGTLDPEKYWAQSGKSKILARIGVALGGFSAGVHGGPNQVLDGINHQIDQWTNAKKSDLAVLKDKLNINQDQFQRMNAEIDKKGLFDKDMAGLTMQQIASRQAGSVAYATGMQQAGALLAQNVMNKQNLIASQLQSEAMPVLTRMQLRTQQADINSKQQTLQFQQMNANMQAAQMGMPIPFPNASNGRTLTQWLSGQGSASTGIYTPHEAMLARMPNTDDEQGVRVPVVLPNGQTAAVPRFLKHKEDREKFNDAQNHVQAFQQAIDNYGEDAKDPSYIGQIAGGNQTLKTSADQLMKAYNELTTGSTRYTETDAKAAGHSIGYTDGGRGLLDLMFSNPQKAIPVLNKIAEEAGIRTADTYLMGGRKAAIPGHKYNQQEIDSMPEGFFARGK